MMQAIDKLVLELVAHGNAGIRTTYAVVHCGTRSSHDRKDVREQLLVIMPRFGSNDIGNIYLGFSDGLFSYQDSGDPSGHGVILVYYEVRLVPSETCEV